MSELFDKLVKYSDVGVYPLHMPGHKRNLLKFGYDNLLNEIYKIDITEIDDFDDLHDPKGVIKRAEEKAAKLYESEYSHYLVNGSTVGILTAVSSVSKRGDTLIIARNCHKSVYNAAYINRLKLRFVYPEFDDKYGIYTQVSVKALAISIARAINEGLDIAGIVITSPTYEGISSDIAELSKLSHDNDIPLIVDEAHGSHFGFCDYFPDSAIHQGADIVIHSLHKTLPAPTQTALIHLNGDLVSDNEIRKYLDIYETSSPSYILMSGIEVSLDIVNDKGRELLTKLYQFRVKLDKEVDNLKHIRLCHLSEPGKVLIYAEGMSGLEISDYLRCAHKIEMEMSMPHYALGILTMMDEEEGIDRLVDALSALDKRISESNRTTEEDEKRIAFLVDNNMKAKRGIEYHSALDAKACTIDIDKATDKICADMIMLYPPGALMIVPGEIISEDFIANLHRLNELGFDVRGIKDGKIRVLVD